MGAHWALKALNMCILYTSNLEISLLWVSAKEMIRQVSANDAVLWRFFFFQRQKIRNSLNDEPQGRDEV